jgi:hypothetical protein
VGYRIVGFEARIGCRKSRGTMAGYGTSIETDGLENQVLEYSQRNSDEFRGAETDLNSLMK